MPTKHDKTQPHFYILYDARGMALFIPKVFFITCKYTNKYHDSGNLFKNDAVV